MMTYVDFLKKVPLFSELDDEELQQITTVVREQHYKKHTTIVHVDDPGNALYILKSGLVKVTIEDRDGYEMILRILYPTDFFGDMSLLDGEPRSATVTTQEPSEVLTVSRDHFLHIIEKSPKILLKMTALLSKRLRKANELIHSLAFFDVYGKVARTLLNLASERGRVTERGTVIDMRLTQQELAELAGMTRETMARTLREFQQAGCIRVESGIISILALDMLRREVRQA
jgi:CRP/FNR family transcriptional regulator, cyclic AMP receptor protein